MKKETINIIKVEEGTIVYIESSLVPDNEPDRQALVTRVEERYLDKIADLTGFDRNDEMDEVYLDGRFDYAENCSIQLHWSTIELPC